MADTNRAELKALEKVFEAEVNNALPFQSKAAIYKRLRDGGLVQDMAVPHGTGAFTIWVRGYQLTHAGRMLYCISCSEDPAPAIPESARKED